MHPLLIPALGLKITKESLRRTVLSSSNYPQVNLPVPSRFTSTQPNGAMFACAEEKELTAEFIPASVT